MSADAIFCKVFNLEIPKDKQRGFCAMQYRRGRAECLGCERGKECDRADRAEVHANLPGEKARSGKSERLHRANLKDTPIEKEAPMAKEIKKVCKKHGEFTTTGPAGKCPKCKDEKETGGGKEPPKAAAKKKHKAPGDAAEILDVLLKHGAITELQVRAARDLAASSKILNPGK